jgi:hypothetical protein
LCAPDNSSLTRYTKAINRISASTELRRRIVEAMAASNLSPRVVRTRPRSRNCPPPHAYAGARPTLTGHYRGDVLLAALTRSEEFWVSTLVRGVVSWFAFLRGGSHPALAVVLIIPFLPHARRDLVFVNEHGHDRLSEFELWWRTPVPADSFCVTTAVAISRKRGNLPRSISTYVRL